LDLLAELWGEVFEPLKDVAEFAKLRVDDDLDTIVWPNGADLSPEWSRQQVKAAREGVRAAEQFKASGTEWLTLLLWSQVNLCSGTPTRA